jgi:hypothetical protein
MQRRLSIFLFLGVWFWIKFQFVCWLLDDDGSSS